MKPPTCILITSLVSCYSAIGNTGAQFASEETSVDRGFSEPQTVIRQMAKDTEKKPFPGNERMTKVVMQLDWIFNAQFAGIFQAASSGFFKEAGLDVEIRPKVENQQTVAAVLDGDIVFGSAESNVLLLELEKGADIRAVATMFQDSPMAWMFKADQGIEPTNPCHRVKLIGGARF